MVLSSSRLAIILTTAAFLSMGCSDPVHSSSGSSDSPSNDPDRGSQTVPKDRPCFKGNAGVVRCWPGVALANIPSNQSALYQYPDPLKDSSFPTSFTPEIYAAPARLLNLEAIPEATDLSPNFLRVELLPANLERGIFGLFSRVALGRIQSLRDAIGKPMSVYSGYRSPGRNSTIPGAAKWSRHTYGDAIDFAVTSMSYDSLASLCLKNGASFYQLYTDHIHCDWRNSEKDLAFFDGPAVPSPTSKVTPAADQDAFTMMTRASEIEIEPRLMDSESISTRLIVTTPQEDDGELTYQWTVKPPAGERWTASTSAIELKSGPGTYEVHVNVGGSVELQRQITIR